MAKKLIVVLTGIAMSLFSCAFIVDGTSEWSSDDSSGTINTPPPKPVNRQIATRGYFPFDNNSNWWMYSERGSANGLCIKVTDTISDDGIVYFRVAFQEHRVDTTDDWFKRDGGNILFGASLAGRYDLFLPQKVSSSGGSISSGSTSAQYTCYDSLVIGGWRFRNVIALSYTVAAIHGFEEVWMVDSIGIVQLKDKDGRWPLTYMLDSCSVNGVLMKF